MAQLLHQKFRKNRILLAFSIFTFSLFSCSNTNEVDEIYNSPPTTPTKTVENNPIPKTHYSSMELEVLNLVNNHRKTLNLSQLKNMDYISGVAETHTVYMISQNKPSHDNFNTRSYTIMNQLQADKVGENVAYGYSSAQGVMNGWLNSEKHRDLIESPNYTHFGISSLPDEEGHNYFTLILAERSFQTIDQL